ncbi:MAG: ATP-dependent DNA helicase [Spirochaetaceae bacterium]|nr:ATP-dependent DNA helicase [Spirochaetaceae bacterium]
MDQNSFDNENTASPYKIDVDTACSYISYGGSLEKLSEYFEERPAQINLVKSICNTFNNNGVGVFEAGTGVGKSFAYLIPSILWAYENKERVVISTGTINLQQQLAEKDIPIAIKITGKPVNFILLKGRQNYICLRRLQDQISEPDLFNQDTKEYDALIKWAKTTTTGNRSDLSFSPSEQLWRSICSESDACMGNRCQYNNQCFVMKVRKEAANAQILIVNHHLLFADIETRLAGVGYEDTAVLPPYKRLIFDEAHDIEDAATSFFSEDLTKFKLLKQLRLLYRKKVNSSSISGLLFTISALSMGEDTTTEVIYCIEEIKKAMEELEETTLAILDYQFTLRISNSNAHMFLNLFNALNNLATSIGSCCGLIRNIISEIKEGDLESQPVWECKTILRRLDSICIFCKSFEKWEELSDKVFFIEKKNNSSNRKNANYSSKVYCRYVIAPLEINTRINEGIFEPMKSVVCTSATLCSGNGFLYWINRTGANFVDENRLYIDQYDSPFPYDKNMLLAVPTNIPLPDKSDYSAFVEQAILKLILSSDGKTLVLFTSYEALKSASDYIRFHTKGTGINILCQGDDDRFRLLETFKNDIQSVLFATDSFWEGVDVPGESLSQVIITKLPFAVPSDPVFAARCESIEKRGGYPFIELSIPDAIIKFRQGVGRLIRRSVDRGIVVVLDKRIIEKSYGKYFLSSIPNTKKIFDPLESICSSVERFLY